MTKSYYHLDTIPSDLMDIVERDLSEQFGSDMVQSGLYNAEESLGESEILALRSDDEKKNKAKAF